jgi:hypothetical protein
MIAGKLGNTNELVIKEAGYNKAYTASNERLLNEMGDFAFTALSEGIDRQIAWQRSGG